VARKQASNDTPLHTSITRLLRLSDQSNKESRTKVGRGRGRDKNMEGNEV
jgi:hypothetical protein